VTRLFGHDKAPNCSPVQLPGGRTNTTKSPPRPDETAPQVGFRH
jgi:hypothetical protein